MKSIKKIPIFWLIILILVLPGIFVAAMRCMLRNVAEEGNKCVETVVDLYEFRQLAREDGWNLEDLFARFKANGVSSVSISEDTLASLELEGKITVLSTKEIRKLSLEETYDVKLPVGTSALAGLWVHSDDDRLLDRITQNLSWKLPESSLIRVHRNLLLINKSGKGIMEKVGLGFSDEYFEMAARADLGIVVRIFNYPGLSADSAYKMINAIPSPASVSALIFADEEMLGARGDLNNIISQFKNRSYRIGWIEFDIQDGIREYLDGLSDSRPFVRVHSISRKEMDMVYTVDRAVARWVRAVKDRSMKMLYFRCFFQDDKKYISNLTEYNLDYIRKTVNAINNAGFEIADTEEKRFQENRHIVEKQIPAETLAMGISLVLGLAILLKLSFIPKLSGFGALSFAFLAIILFFCAGNHFVAVTGLIGAISYSCIGYVFAGNSIENTDNGFVKNSIKYSLALVLPSIIGGILIAGIYSNIEYLLKFEQFRGIKLAFIIPLIFSVAWSLKKYGKNVFSLLQKPMTIISALIIACVLASLALYIIRSGNTLILKPTAIEDSARTFLENTLVARPRNKEFLVGYPAAMLFVMMLMRKEFILLPLMALFIQMGQVSVVNTMCHFHTPIRYSLLRIVNGLWLGVLIGFLCVLCWRCLQILVTYSKGKQKRVFLAGYFGYDNAGDELLRESYTKKLLEKLQNYTVDVLMGSKKPREENDRVVWIPRKDFTSVIEELIACEALVIPGGGVFQSVTSCRSLAYYLSVVRLARLFNTRVILPAQGLGPWKKNGLFSGWLHAKLANELKKATYLTVRDVSSMEKFKEITSIENEVERTTDLAFLNDNFISRTPAEKIDFLRIFVVLRKSVKGSVEIATELIKLANENENIEIIPIAFQPGEDTIVWQKAGWDKEIKTVECFENAFEGADVVISMRLHGCIIATNMGIPWVGITYDPKVTSFAESCNWLEYCCEPSENCVGFIEGCINQFAYDYQKNSEKLTKVAEKLHKRAVDDFERSIEAITRIIVVVFMLAMLNTTAYAENEFPAWMDEVNFNQSNSDRSAAFTGPVDPSTGQTTTLESKRGNKFKPNLPDFSELRKKATKTESKGFTSTEIEETSKAPIKQDSHQNKLATAAAVIEALQRLASDTAAAISPTVEAEDDREPTDEELLKRNTYRPGQIKSFYIENKEAEKRKQEEVQK